jgi:hypothetical protein
MHAKDWFKHQVWNIQEHIPNNLLLTIEFHEGHGFCAALGSSTSNKILAAIRLVLPVLGSSFSFKERTGRLQVRYLYEPLTNSSPTSKTQFRALTDGSPKS